MDEKAYYERQRPFKILQHSRIYAAVIGSYLALDNKPLADSLMEEMKFWRLQPLRETYYDYLDVSIMFRNEDQYCDRSEQYKTEYESFLRSVNTQLTDTQQMSDVK